MEDIHATNLPQTIHSDNQPQNAVPADGKKIELRVGGFPEEMFLNITDGEREEFVCNICLNLVNQCQKCSNSHIFCKSCIFVWTQVPSSNSERCPVCRSPQSEYSAVPEIDQKLLEKDVTCPMEDCSFRSTLRLFLLHVHGMSTYCNEQCHYDAFKAERRVTTEEHLAGESERLVELVTFIERFNILQSLMSFEAMLGNNQSFTLLNLLHSIAAIPDRTNLAGPNPLWDLSVPASLMNSIDEFDLPSLTNESTSSALENRLSLHGNVSSNSSNNAAGVVNLSSDRNANDYDEDPSRNRLVELSLDAQSSFVFDSFPSSGRLSNISSLSSLSSAEGQLYAPESESYHNDTTRRLDDLSDSDEEGFIDFMQARTTGIHAEGMRTNNDFSFLQNDHPVSASTDTLLGGLAEDMDFRTMMSSFEDDFDISLNVSGMFEDKSNCSSEDLASNLRSLVSACPSEPQEFHIDTSSVNSTRSQMLKPSTLPFRSSGASLTTARKIPRGITRKEELSQSPFYSTYRTNRATNHFESTLKKPQENKKPFTYSSRMTSFPERPVLCRPLILKSDKSKVGMTYATGPNTKEADGSSLSRPKLSKTTLLKPQKETSRNIEARSIRQIGQKVGETYRIPVGTSSKSELFKLPSIYSSATPKNQYKINNPRLSKEIPDKDKNVLPKSNLYNIKHKY